MDLIVSAAQANPGMGNPGMGNPGMGNPAQAAYRGRTYACAIGRSGIATQKIEGDGASPPGRFHLLRILYRPDRVDCPDSRLNAIALQTGDGWCDDPAHPDYNRQVKLPHPARCEKLWRDDGLYDIVVVTSHNDDPVVPGVGSGIFVHVAGSPDYPATEGCIAFAREDLLAILADWQPETDALVIR